MAAPSTPGYNTMTRDQLEQVNAVKTMKNKPKLRSFDTSNAGRDLTRLTDYLAATVSEEEKGRLLTTLSP